MSQKLNLTERLNQTHDHALILHKLNDLFGVIVVTWVQDKDT